MKTNSTTNSKKVSGDGCLSSLHRSDPEIRAIRAACRVGSAWHRPSVELSGQRDWTCLLGAITEDGDCFLSQFTEYVIAVMQNISFTHYAKNSKMI